MQIQDDDVLLEQESDSDANHDDTWLVLIVDDDKSVHDVTRYVLGSFRFMHKGMTLLSAYSGAEALEIVKKYPTLALVLLDVVMETRDAGLRCADAIRNVIQNRLVRIILRTGQPGDAPQLEVMLKYDINDYKEKGDLTEMKLLSAVTAALRSYNDVKTIARFNESLEAKVQERTEELRLAHRALSEVQQRQERELMEARALQQAMLPKKAPEADWYKLAAVQETAAEVGGDYYDFFPQADGSLLIVCGDATGHGLKAGMMVTLTKALLMVFHAEYPPEESAARISSIIKSMRLGNLFMGLTLARLTKESLTLVSAGMPPTLLRRSDGSIEALFQKTMPLGAFAHLPLQPLTTQLASGDTLLFCSDGFAESFNVAAEMLGDEALAGIMENKGMLLSEELVAECARVEEAWRGEAERHDDMTLVAVKIL